MEDSKKIALKKILKMPTAKCDRCGGQIDLDNDQAICFNSADGQIYMCEPCVEIVKREFIDEIRETNIIESDIMWRLHQKNYCVSQGRLVPWCRVSGGLCFDIRSLPKV